MCSQPHQRGEIPFVLKLARETSAELSLCDAYSDSIIAVGGLRPPWIARQQSGSEHAAGTQARLLRGNCSQHACPRGGLSTLHQSTPYINDSKASLNDRSEVFKCSSVLK